MNTNPLRTALLCGLMTVAACTVAINAKVSTGVGEIVINVTGVLGATPPGWTPLAIKGSYDGKTYDLYDTDGDGKVDHVRETGSTKTFEIEPAKVSQGSTNLVLLPVGPTLTLASEVKLRGTPPDQIYVKEPESPIDFVPTQGDLQYLADHGLDQLSAGFNVLSDVIEVNSIRTETDPEPGLQGIYLDVTVHWNGAWDWPSEISHYPGLGYNWHNVSDDPEAMGAYWFLQVDGQAEHVLKWLADFGFGAVHYQSVVLETSAGDVAYNNVSIVFDDDSQLADVQIEGRTALVIPFLK